MSFRSWQPTSAKTVMRLLPGNWVAHRKNFARASASRHILAACEDCQWRNDEGRVGHPVPQYADRYGLACAKLNCNSELEEAIRQRDSSEATGLARKLFGSPTMTLTGRVRGRVSFAAARNTPFSGLAADGAKLAVYQLVRAGYVVRAFIHDEFLVELPDDADWVNGPKRIDKIICDAMASVCGSCPLRLRVHG